MKSAEGCVVLVSTDMWKKRQWGKSRMADIGGYVFGKAAWPRVRLSHS